MIDRSERTEKTKVKVQSTQKKILITGASGRIGSLMLDFFKDAYHCRCIDLNPVQKANEFQRININNYKTVVNAMQGIDIVLHLASPRINQPWEDFYSTGILGSYNIFEAARVAGVKKIIYASSFHVLGWAEPENGELVHADMPVQPDSIYGASKVFAEALGRFYSDKYGISVICLRIGSFASEPNPKNKNDRLYKTWLSPRDLAQLIQLSIEKEDLGFQIFYGVSNNTQRFWDISNAQKLLGYNPQDNIDDFVPKDPALPSLRVNKVTGLRKLKQVLFPKKLPKVYTISDSSGTSRAEVVPERGGMITRWLVDDRDILYIDRNTLLNSTGKVQGGIPILFPICGNLQNNTYTYQGKSYILNRHGFARNLPWKVETSSAQNTIQLSLSHNPKTLKVYPFKFRYTVTYTMEKGAIVIQHQIVNLSPETMPFSWGLHPYFLVRDPEDLKWDIPASSFQEQKTGTIREFSGNFDFNQDEIDAIFHELTAQKIKVADPSRDLSIEVEYTDPFRKLVFWTLKDKNFYCLEPWSHESDALNQVSKNRINLLESRSSLEAVVTIGANFRE
jgi:galactose mutarotase-like enzyme